MSTHDTELEIDIDSLLDEESSSEQDVPHHDENSGAIKKIALNSSLSAQDMSSMLKKFIHGNKDELERAVEAVVEQNETMRKQIALAAQKRRATVAVQEPEDEDLEHIQNTSAGDLLENEEEPAAPSAERIAPSIYPPRTMSVVDSAMDLNGQAFSFKPIPETDASSAPSFIRGLGLLRLTPTFKSLSVHDIEEGVSPLARVGFIPLSGSLAMMRDSKWPEFGKESMLCDSPQTLHAVSQRIEYARAFMEQNNACVFNEARILDSWNKYTQAGRVHVAVTDDATYCLIESKYILGDSATHRQAHSSDGRVLYPYHRSNQGEVNVVIAPDESSSYPTVMLFGFSGGRDYLRALIQKENSNLLTESEVEEKLSEKLNAITQETMEAFINDTRTAYGANGINEGDIYNASDITDNSAFLRAVSHNEAQIGDKYFKSLAKNHTRTCLQLLGDFPKDSSELDLSGGRMTVIRKQRIDINESGEGSHKMPVDIFESLTLDSDRTDKATAITDFVVSARGVLRLQAQIPQDAPISLETKRVSQVMKDAREMAYRCANKMRTMSYEIRNYAALKEAYNLHGCYAEIARDNQNYTISQSDCDRSEELRASLHSCLSSVGTGVMAMRNILRPSNDEEEFSLPRVPLTIMIEDPLIREGLAAIMNRDPEECCVISTHERGENTLLMSDIYTVLQAETQEFIDRLTPLFPIVGENDPEPENIVGTQNTNTAENGSAPRRESGILEM